MLTFFNYCSVIFGIVINMYFHTLNTEILYLDYVIVYGKTFGKNLERLNVFARFRSAEVKLKQDCYLSGPHCV